MKAIVWSPGARRSFDNDLACLNERNPAAARRADRKITEIVEGLGRRTMPGRPSKCTGLRATSALDWHKIIVFQVADDHIRFVGFYDARQDDRRFDFKPE